jgi:hypothetical protein
MRRVITKPDLSQPAIETSCALFDDWFDPIEIEIRVEPEHSSRRWCETSLTQRWLVLLVLSGTMHLPFVAPWDFQQYLGRLLRDVGSDRLLRGSEAPITGNPRPAIEWFWNMQIDDELQERHGYPAITKLDKRRVLGLNQARIFNVKPSRPGSGQLY